MKINGPTGVALLLLGRFNLQMRTDLRMGHERTPSEEKE
jgi:hypothetical protein